MAEARGWAKEHASLLQPVDHQFLAESEKKQAALDRDARQAKSLRTRVRVSVVAVIAAIGLAGYAWSRVQVAIRAQQSARAGELLADATLAEAEDPTRAAYVAWHAGQYGRPSPLGLESSIVAAQFDGLSYGILRSGGTEVLDVAWSPNGKTLAAANNNNTLEVWDAATARRLSVLRANSELVYSVAWSPDSKLLASAGNETTIEVWDAATGKQVRMLQGHTQQVSSVAWSPDGKMLASASDDRTVRLWDAASGKQIRVLQGHQNYVTRVAWSPDGKTLASESDDRLYGCGIPPLENRERWLLTRASGTALPGARMGTCSAQRTQTTIWLWDGDAIGGKPLRALHGHEGVVRSIAWSSDRRRGIGRGG